MQENAQLPLDEAAQKKRNKGRWFLIMLFCFCALPIVASLFTYYVWKPAKYMNYGEMLEVKPLPAGALAAYEGIALPKIGESPAWTLLVVDNGTCDAGCVERLYDVRQIWLAMGVHKERVQRVWAVSDTTKPAASLLEQHPGLQLARWQGDANSPMLVPERIYLLDARGNLVLRYPSQPEPKRIIKDIARLLDIKRM